MTLHIRAKPLAVSLLAAVSAVVVWTSVISTRTMAKVPARLANRIIADDMYLLFIIVVIVVIVVVVINNIAIGIVVIITHVVVELMVISSVELIAFVIVIAAMVIAASSHGRIALTMVILGLSLTTDHSLQELRCLTCARRVSDGVALATHMILTVGTLLFMPSYLAELPGRACRNSVLGAMIVTTMSADHDMLCKKYAKILQPSPNRLYSFTFVLRGLANPPGSVDVIPTAGCAQCAWCSLRRFSCVRA